MIEYIYEFNDGIRAVMFDIKNKRSHIVVHSGEGWTPDFPIDEIRHRKLSITYKQWTGRLKGQD